MESEGVEEDPLGLDRHQTGHLGVEKSSEDLVSMASFHIWESMKDQGGQLEKRREESDRKTSLPSEFLHDSLNASMQIETALESCRVV